MEQTIQTYLQGDEEDQTLCRRWTPFQASKCCLSVQLSATSPFVTGQSLCNYRFFSVNSLALLKNIHEEILSLVDGWENFHDFKRFFLELTASKMENGNFTRSHDAITIDLSTRQVDADTKIFMFGQKPDTQKNGRCIVQEPKITTHCCRITARTRADRAVRTR